jgi:ABC-type ATPase involved in cell division
MITFDRVSKRYPNGREALANVTFNIDTGEMVFLTGRSGAGKSTVLKHIALLERPTRGTVLVNGKNTNTLRSRHIPAFRRGIGLVFQDHKLLGDRPVYDNVALPLVVAIARKLGLPIRFIGIGEQPEDFGEFDAQAFAQALVQGPREPAGEPLSDPAGG